MARISLLTLTETPRYRIAVDDVVTITEDDNNAQAGDGLKSVKPATANIKRI